MCYTLHPMRTSLLIVGVVVLTGCALDFQEAVPCDGDEHCPTGRICDLTTEICVDDTREPDGGSGDGGTNNGGTNNGGTNNGGTNNGGVACIDVDPEDGVEFTVTEPGQNSVRTLTVTNCGSAVLGITRISLIEGGDEAFGVQPPLPLNDEVLLLASEASVEIDLMYAPEAEGRHHPVRR